MNKHNKYSQTMKEKLKKSLWKWAAIIAMITLSCIAISNTHNSIASDPHNVKKITGLDLPEIIHTDSEDNLERGTSRWDCFIHRAQFASEISADCIRELDNRCKTDSIHWDKSADGTGYIYTDDAWEHGELYSITCHVYKNHSVVTYYVDEFEGCLTFMLGLTVIALSVIWGITLIIATVRRRRER